MTTFTIREGETSAFSYSYNGYNPSIDVRFVAGTATSADGYLGSVISSAMSNVNGYITASKTYSFGARADTTDEPEEQFTIEIYYNGYLDEIITVIVQDDLAWHGTSENDIWSGDTGSDIYFGYGGADVIRGLNGNDSLNGGTEDDRLVGGKGSDQLDGGTGNDTLEGGKGADELSAGAGNDILFGGGGADRLYGGDGEDNLSGDGGKDDIFGGSGDDSLSGGNGHDALYGGSGNDLIDGGKGRDLINGGAGNDILTGGSSADQFVFAGDFGHDRITDFSVKGREKIDLSESADIKSFRDLAKNFAIDTDGGVLIEISPESSLLIEEIQLAELSWREFTF
ncbi:calcium-binding protein [Neptunicoccus sediminis]|uniref:calcium-binding protein n=1 Tax=Neptunicoccus sediminis TaxID=1892596 RepID=UPI0009F2F09B|nr:calcium-binding protein [Neptunicoccus sediminis]